MACHRGIVSVRHDDAPSTQFACLAPPAACRECLTRLTGRQAARSTILLMTFLKENQKTKGKSRKAEAEKKSGHQLTMRSFLSRSCQYLTLLWRTRTTLPMRWACVRNAW